MTTDAVSGENHEAFSLPAHESSAGEARRRVRSRLVGWCVSEDTLDIALLVVSELVTNAIVHTHSSVINCSLWAGNGRLHIEVADEGGDGPRPAPRQAALDEEGGRGLLLVSTLSEAWGITSPREGKGRAVWASVRSGPGCNGMPLHG